MTTSKFIIAFLTISILASCRQTYRLSEKEIMWMSYNGNETLVFSSNTGDTDTIFFLKKDTLIAYPEAQALNGKTYEVVRIFAKYSNGISRDFVELKKSKDKIARLHFNLSAKDAVFYRLTGLKIDSLSRQQPTSLVTKSKTYNDIYIIESEDWLNFKQRTNYVTKLYWSKSEGLIRYDKQDSVYWELTKKYSP
jgi:hypothetical protein